MRLTTKCACARSIDDDTAVVAQDEVAEPLEEVTLDLDDAIETEE